MKYKHLNIGDYFRSRGYQKIVFWGLDKVSLTIADSLSEDKKLCVLGIFELSNEKANQRENYLNYDTDVNFVLSATELFKIKDLDLILCSEGSVIVFPITGQRVPQNQKVEMCIPDMLRLSLASRNTGLKKKVVSATSIGM